MYAGIFWTDFIYLNIIGIFDIIDKITTNGNKNFTVSKKSSKIISNTTC